MSQHLWFKLSSYTILLLAHYSTCCYKENQVCSVTEESLNMFLSTQLFTILYFWQAEVSAEH